MQKQPDTEASKRGNLAIWRDRDLLRQFMICPKCKHLSGDAWLQCAGKCPVEMSPHFDKATLDKYGPLRQPTFAEMYLNDPDGVPSDPRESAMSADEVRQEKNGRSDARLNELLFGADPDCKHVLDPKCWSGIRCTKCRGWYCA